MSGNEPFTGMQIGIEDPDTGKIMIIVPDSLDAAWAEVEAALPEGWELRTIEFDGLNGAERVDCRAGLYHRGMGRLENHWGDGPTPVATLRALAAKLRENATKGASGATSCHKITARVPQL